jgi:DNA polymerase zeta
MRDVAMPSDPSKPLLDDVLRTLSLGLEFENKLIELCGETKNTLALNPLDKNVKFPQSMTSITGEGNLVGLGHTNTNNIDGEPWKYSKEKEIMGSLSPQGSIREEEIPTEGRDTSIQPLSIDEMRTSAIIETLDPKVIHYEFACLSLKHNFLLTM